ncbi:MAG: VOC family protein [Deltaproteobacteria bacterium]|nr:MAG: VOC family protein [Deltaproteobacteria bacterium]
MGVNNYQAMKAFYQETLEFTNTWEEFPEVWNPMSEVFRTSYHKFGGIMLDQKPGGIVVELIHMSVPHPRPIRKENRYGDIGVNKLTIAVSDVELFYKEMKDKISFCLAPKSTTIPEWGDYNFLYGKDPEGNLIEFVSGEKLQVKERFGGARWLGIGVTDLERSIPFYEKYVGFVSVVVSPHEVFSGLVDEISGSKAAEVRSCLLANPKGGGMVELYELLKPRGRSIPFNTHWGDFGYLEVAVMCDDIHEMARYCEEEGVEFLHRPCFAFEAEDAELWFLYIKDPDGIPVEAVAAMPKR